jgi:DNA (cytosine-5)-methyltransferase 1
MVPLNALRTKRGCDKLMLHGIVSFNGTKLYLNSIPFSILAIEGYGDMECHSVANSIWIQTPLGNANNVWYRLAAPSAEYLRFHSAFLWIADLGKHFVDYLLENAMVCFTDFRCKFYAWLIERHGQSTEFQGWINKFQKTDFRTAIVAYIEYLWKEASDVLPDRDARRHSLWVEADPRALNSIPRQQSMCAKNNSTIVTPFVYNCFSNMYFGSVMEARHVKDCTILAVQSLRREELGFTSDSDAALSMTVLPEMQPPMNIRQGDVVGVMRDVESKWKDNADTWFGTH